MIKVTNKSVRDHSQVVTIRGHLVTVQSKIGAKNAGRYDFPLSAWRDLNNGIGNSVWYKREFVAKHTAHYDNESGGPDQADRIRDAQVCAIDKAYDLAAADLNSL